MADFSFLETSWKCHPAVVSTSEKFLKFVERTSYYKYSGNTRKYALDLLVGNEEGLGGIWHGLGHSDQEMVQLWNISAMRKKNCNVACLLWERKHCTTQESPGNLLLRAQNLHVAWSGICCKHWKEKAVRKHFSILPRHLLCGKPHLVVFHDTHY